MAVFRSPTGTRYYIPARRRRATFNGTFPAFKLSLGLNEAALITIIASDINLSEASLLGFIETVFLQIEVDIPPTTAALGVTQAATLRTEADLALTEALGLTQAATLRTEANIAALTEALGFIETVVLRTEADLALTEALGFTETVTLRTEADLAASNAVAATMTSIPANVIFCSQFFDGSGGHCEIQLSSVASLADGLLLTVTGVTVAPEANGVWPIVLVGGGFVNLLGSGVPSNTGASSNGTAFLEPSLDTTGNNRIATDGSTRVTTDGTIRQIKP